MERSKNIAKRLLAILLCAYSLVTYAHEGHDHGAKKSATSTTKSYFTSWTVSDKFELVVHYPPMDAGKTSRFTLYLSDFETNEPIRNASIKLSATEDKAITFTVKPSSPGIYFVDAVFSKEQVYYLSAAISAVDKHDLMLLQGIEIGKELTAVEETIKTDGFDWKPVLYLLAGLLGGAILAFLVLRRNKRNNVTEKI